MDETDNLNSCDVNSLDDEVGDVGVGLLSSLSRPETESSLAEKNNSKTPDGANSLEETADEYQEGLAKKAQRATQLTWIYIFLSLSVLGSWMLGQMGFCVAWVLLLLLLVGVVWQASFSRLVEETLIFEKIRLQRRRALQTDESAEWLNFLINRWWIFSSPTIFTLIKNSLDPLLNESKPAFLDFVELREFTLGDNTPFVNWVKAFDVTSGIRKPFSSLLGGGMLSKPRFDLAESLKCQLALEMDVGLFCPDFRMLLRARLGGKGVGMDLDIAMEKLNISGKLNVNLSLNMESAFPHVTKASFSFAEKPEVWFNLRILKAVQMMEVPGLKTWVHSLVMDALTTALVDPGKLDVNVCAVDGFVPSQTSSNSLAQGVLTLTLSRAQQNNKVLAALNEEERWCVIYLGEQKQVTSRVSSSVRWQECRTFLVENLAVDKLNIKLKTKRLISTITMAQYEVPLASFDLEANNIVETVLQKKGGKSVMGAPNMNLRMEYTPLIPIDLTGEMEIVTENEVAGVIYVCIHGAEELVASDKRGSPNPYCIIFCNRKKVKTSHYVCHTSNPKWGTSAEFLVSDYLQMVLSFAICNWDTNKMADSDLLGIGSLAMTADESVVLKRQIPLTFNVAGNASENKLGSITVSAVFRPVPSVAESDSAQMYSLGAGATEDDDNQRFKLKKTNSSFMQSAKMFLSNSKDPDGITSLDFGDILSSGSGLMEITVLRARDLVAKDLNGFSDPYCEIKIDNECIFKTSIKKKTLNPEWDECATLQLPRAGETLAVIVWDRDPLGMRDFLGNVLLTVDEIRQISSAENPTQWFTLMDTKTGQIELKIKVISEDFESQEGDKGTSSDKPQMMSSPGVSPTVPSWSEQMMTKSSSVIAPSPAPSRKMPIALPSPVPPRKTSQLSVNGASDGTDSQSSHAETSQLKREETQYSPPNSLPLTSTPLLPTRVEPREPPTKLQLSPTDNAPLKNAKSNLRTTPEYSSIRAMKQKMKYGLTHPLRRFRSEASVHEPKAKTMRDRVTVETRDPSMTGNDFDSLVQATSHPDISQLITSPIEPKESPTKEAKTRYYNVQGRVIQGRGFQASQQSLIYCRVRIHRTFGKSSRSSSGKTICKSSLTPSSLNPHFDTEFQIESSSGVLKTAVLVVDIRTDKKETIATKTIVLKEVFEDSAADSQEVVNWYGLSNGAKLEIEISHGKPIEKKQSSNKLFRSWSVHRIGKI